MAYELYKKRTAAWRSVEPRVTISHLGRLHFNAAATQQLKEKKAQHVHLLYDGGRHKVAMRLAEKPDGDTFEIHYPKKGTGAGFAAKTFLADIKYKNGTSAVFLFKWDDRKKMLEFALGDGTAPRSKP